MPPAAPSAGHDEAGGWRSHPGAACWSERLRALHAAVRRAAAATSAVDLGRRNAKGDLVKDFDLAADRAIAELLGTLAVPLVLESEEGPSRIIGGEPPEWRLIADPVDGSDNRARGLPSSAFSCAVLAAGAALQPEAVVAAIVGPMEGDEAWVATVGAGAWHGPARLATSTVTDLAEAMLSVELNHCHPSPALGRIMGLARGVRSYGCASRALALVAAGALRRGQNPPSRRRRASKPGPAGEMAPPPPREPGPRPRVFPKEARNRYSRIVRDESGLAARPAPARSSLDFADHILYRSALGECDVVHR